MNNDASLLEIATRFRKAIENIPINKRPLGMKTFPKGACGDSALLLGAYLKDLGISEFRYICGSRGDYNDCTRATHAWLQKENFIIDITSDQFSDAPIGIIVSDSSLWHRTFSVDSPSESDFRLLNGGGVDELWNIYALILSVMDNMIDINNG